MSVLTTITESELTNFLDQYSLGQLQRFSGIQEGTVNTNYRVVIEEKTYILTIFEVLNQSDAEQYLSLTEFLSAHNISCAQAIRDKQGQIISRLKNKPACLVHFISGHKRTNPTPNDCFQIGKYLAQLHLKATQFSPNMTNPMGVEWRKQATQKIMYALSAKEKDLAQNALMLQETIPWSKLPKSTIHYDFFRDNVFFQGNELTGVIDFYYACYDAMLLDLVIAINDWCTNWEDPSLNINNIHLNAIIDGYQTARRLEPIEKKHFKSLLQVMSFHFWLARKASQLYPPDGEKVTLKDPEEFKKIHLNWCQNKTFIV